MHFLDLVSIDLSKHLHFIMPIDLICLSVMLFWNQVSDEARASLTLFRYQGCELTHSLQPNCIVTFTASTVGLHGGVALLCRRKNQNQRSLLIPKEIAQAQENNTMK